MYSMLRQILGNHAYHTGDSHQQALHRQGIALPLEWVIRTVDTLLQSASQRLLYATDSDIVHHLDWSHLHQLKACLEMHLHTGPAVPVTDLPEGDLPPEPIYQCNICPFRATDVASFRRHCAIVHGTHMNRQINADHTKYMLNGLPQCRFCFKTFTTWRSFNIHIQRGCQVLLAGPAECWHQPFADLRADPVPGHTMFAPKQDGPVRGQTVLSDGDLTNLRSQEWGSRILTIVGTKNWHHMTGEPAACTYLASRCCLCDQYLGRTQDLNHHLKVYHPEFWPNTAAKGKQLTLLHGEEVPCPFCHALFSNMHQCTVWTQMALLLIYGGGQNTMETPATQPGLQCELCNMTLDTQDALHSHLSREHRLVSASFNPARDCLGGEPACNHCEALFDNIESLRSHINKGECQRFDPNLPTEVLGIQPEWTAATCEGKLADILRDPHARLRLTLQCQNCSSRYTRASDVACHLQSSHTSLWNASQGLTAILVSMLYNAVGCLCNPSVSQARANHVCLPIRQLAMQHLRLHDVVLFPRNPTEEELTHLFSPGLARADRFMLERLMTTQNIQAFWQDAAVLTLTRSICLLCSATVPGPDLVVHMYEAHQCGEDVVKFIIQQLVPKFQQENANNCQCDACLQVFNTPRDDSLGTCDDARTAVVQAHYRAQCPCLLQVAVILGRAAHGRYGNARGGRGHSADLASVPGHGSNVGCHTEAEPTGTTQATKKRRTQTGRTSQAKGSTRPAAADTGNVAPGQTGDQDGSRATADEERGHLHFLFRQQRQRRLSPGVGAGNGSMGDQTPGTSAITTIDADDAAETAFDASPFQHPADPGPEVGGGTGWIRCSEGGAAQSGIAGRQELPLPGLGPQQEGAGDQQKATIEPPENPPDLHRPAGSPDGPPIGSEIPCPTRGPKPDGLPMEASDQHAPGWPVAAAEQPMSLGNLVAGGNIAQKSQPSAESLGESTAADLEPPSEPIKGEGQRETQSADGDEAGMRDSTTPLQREPWQLMQILAHMTLGKSRQFMFFKCHGPLPSMDHTVS